MSGRQAKKLRKLVAMGALEIEKKTLDQMEKRFSGLFKPKPKWMPLWLYGWLMKKLVNQP